jgi:hypothetical protein
LKDKETKIRQKISRVRRQKNKGKRGRTRNIMNEIHCPADREFRSEFKSEAEFMNEQFH